VSVTGENEPKTGENDISAKKQKYAITSDVFNGLHPVSGDYRLDSQFSERGDTYQIGMSVG